jgi:hypothetical protein
MVMSESLAVQYIWNGSAAISHVPEEWKGSNRITTPGGQQEMLTLTEQGLYFFLGRSDKVKALPFKDNWSRIGTNDPEQRSPSRRNSSAWVRY